MRVRRGFYCAVNGCRSVPNGIISFFRFPSDPNRLLEWIRACNRPELYEKDEKFIHDTRVCAKHFEDNVFLNDLKNRLQPRAKPTMFLSVDEVKGAATGSTDNELSNEPSCSSTKRFLEQQASGSQPGPSGTTSHNEIQPGDNERVPTLDNIKQEPLEFIETSITIKEEPLEDVAVHEATTMSEPFNITSVKCEPDLIDTQQEVQEDQVPQILNFEHQNPYISPKKEFLPIDPDTDETELDEIDLRFLGFAKRFKKISSTRQRAVDDKFCQILNEAEMEEAEEKQFYS